MVKIYHPPNGYCAQEVKRKPPKVSGTCGKNAYHFHPDGPFCTKHFRRKK